MKFKRMGVTLLGVTIAFLLGLATAGASPQPPRIVHPLLDIAPAHTFVVTKTTDSGDNTHAGSGTLRWALVSANNSSGFDLIVFNLPGKGVQTIKVKNYFPDITDNAGVMIDGTQSDDQIEIDGSGVNNHHGLSIVSSNNVIKGLTINGVKGGGAGIAIQNGASNNLIIGNRIGTNSAGTAANGNNSAIYINHANGNIIGGINGVNPGGACTGDCNLLSGNRLHGIVVSNSSNTRLIGTFSGVNSKGTGAIPNTDDGILLSNSNNNTIGGAVAQRNIIAANHTINIEVGNSGSHNNTIQGNYIGTNSAGNAVLSNPGTGIVVDLSAHDNTIDSNVISGHHNFGIFVFKSASRTTITNNRIGIAANSDANLGNRQSGIQIQANRNTIQSNRIMNNGGIGIRIKSGTGNAVRMNNVYNNSSFGVILGAGFTANDAGDGDGGPDNMQNFPTLNAAKLDATGLLLKGSLNSRANGRYTLDFFYTPKCDNNFGHPVGEGKQYLGSTTVTTDGSGNVNFSFKLGVNLGSGTITSTATDSGNNTSAFSYCRTLTQ
jgi:parallel beta-helix repeat protein